MDKYIISTFKILVKLCMGCPFSRAMLIKYYDFYLNKYTTLFSERTNKHLHQSTYNNKAGARNILHNTLRFK